MEWTYAWPLHTYYAAYTDPVKSLPHQNPAGVVENPKGLPFWIPLQRYLVSLEDYLDVVGEMKNLETYKLDDPILDKPLIEFFVEKGKSAIWDGQLGNGMIAMKYVTLGPLMAYRKREDGLLGIESLSGFIDTRLSVAEGLKYPSKFPAHVRRTSKEDANFSTLLSKAKAEADKKKLEKEKLKFT